MNVWGDVKVTLHHRHVLLVAMAVELHVVAVQHLPRVPAAARVVDQDVVTVLLPRVQIAVHNVHPNVKVSLPKHARIVLLAVVQAAAMIATILVLGFVEENAVHHAEVNVKENVDMAVQLSVLDMESKHTAHHVEERAVVHAMKIAPMIATKLAKAMDINN